MKKKKILVTFGTRPEAIKMAPLVKLLQKESDFFETIVCVTGQHRQMLDQVLNIFDIVPDFDLDIMCPGQDLYDVTNKVLIGMRDILERVSPEIVLVHGDTTTSMATALAAFYKQIPVGHIEAGLRTNDIYSPWPEELNRQITSRISRFNFTPTKLSKDNLINENVDPKSILITGNTVIDALNWVTCKIKTNDKLQKNIILNIARNGYNLNRLETNKKLILITGHRRENFGKGFDSICLAIKSLAEKYTDVDFVYPMHLNPNVRKPIYRVFGESLTKFDNLFFIEPLEYLSFVYIMNKSYLILTDSGGIQEEAPSLGKPVLVMRETTERPEALIAGTIKLVGTDYSKILDSISTLLDNDDLYNTMSKASNPYGDGLACKRIVNFLKENV